MSVNPLLLLVIGLVGGLLAGALLVAWWYEGQKAPPDSESNVAGQAASEAPVAPAPPAPPPASLLSLRRASDGELEVYLHGIRLASPGHVTHDQRQQLVDLVVELRPWVSSSPAPTPSAPTSSKRAATTPVATIPPTPLEESPLAPLRSIALQIDEVLQEMLETSPLKARGISLREGPGHSVVVWVGAQSYAGIEEVPDEDVRALLRAAVEEWQRRNLPGEAA